MTNRMGCLDDWSVVLPSSILTMNKEPIINGTTISLCLITGPMDQENLILTILHGYWSFITIFDNFISRKDALSCLNLLLLCFWKIILKYSLTYAYQNMDSLQLSLIKSDTNMFPCLQLSLSPWFSLGSKWEDLFPFYLHPFELFRLYLTFIPLPEVILCSLQCRHFSPEHTTMQRQKSISRLVVRDIISISAFQKNIPQTCNSPLGYG